TGINCYPIDLDEIEWSLSVVRVEGPSSYRAFLSRTNDEQEGTWLTRHLVCHSSVRNVLCNRLSLILANRCSILKDE
ncbi:hypothetical protein CRM22_003945, partial [Opisthorchis felineus]